MLLRGAAQKPPHMRLIRRSVALLAARLSDRSDTLGRMVHRVELNPVACVCPERGHCADVKGDPLACPLCVELTDEQPCPTAALWDRRHPRHPDHVAGIAGLLANYRENTGEDATVVVFGGGEANRTT